MAAVIPERQAELPMTGAVVRMLVDGRYFLQHLENLQTEGRVVATCARCGQIPRAIPLVGRDVIGVACGCRAGEVKTDQPLDVAPLVAALGWTLQCADCGSPVSGDNDPQALVFSVTCPCRTRTYRVPVN